MEINEQNWDEYCKIVVEDMFDHVKQFCSPISKSEEHDFGELLGTGSYFHVNSSYFLLTNEHVVSEAKGAILGHQIHGAEDVYRITNPFSCLKYPIDIAVTKLDGRVLIDRENGISKDRIDATHEPVNNELIFLLGYSGDRSLFSFGHLVSHGTPYLTRIVDFENGKGNPLQHFGIDYRPDLAWSVDNTSSLPRPMGMSGSLVWNTKFVEATLKGEIWTPEMARVTGIVWYWSQSDACLLATKIEHIDLLGQIDKAVKIAKF